MEAKIEGVNRERAGQIRASLIGRTRDGHEVRWQSDVADGVREEDGVVRWHQRLPEGVTHGRSWFHDRGFLVGETEFSLPDHGRKDGPERVLAVASGDNDFLRNGLDTIGSDSKKLENWVHLLFHCLGWRSLLIGRMGKWETADVIAHPPQGKEVVVVECTTSTPSQSNKLEKLYARSREIARQTSLTVIPVLATVQITTDIPDTAKEEAGKSDIALLTMEDLERLAEMVCEPEGQDASDFIRERIPRQWPESGLLSRFGSRAGFL